MKVFKESLVREMLFKRQDSMHDIGQSLATHFCIAYADIEEYTVMKKVGVILHTDPLRKNVVAESFLKVIYMI